MFYITVIYLYKKFNCKKHENIFKYNVIQFKKICFKIKHLIGFKNIACLLLNISCTYFKHDNIENMKLYEFGCRKYSVADQWLCSDC